MNLPRNPRGDRAMADIADIIGDEAARKLADAFGGTILYVPPVPGVNHPIAVAIGVDAADRLGAHVGGERMLIPKEAARRARVLELRKYHSLTVAQIARQTAYSERHVYRLLRNEADDFHPGEADDPQTSIFDHLD